jgi:hypothetical protein
MIDDGSIQILWASQISQCFSQDPKPCRLRSASKVPHLDGIHLATPREEDVINELSPLLRAFTMDFLATKKNIAGDHRR